MAEHIATEDEIEQARDTLAEEALVAFFAAQMLMDGDEGDGPELDLSVERWAIRGARRLFQIYYSGVRRRGYELRSAETGNQFTPSQETLDSVSTSVKALRRSIRTAERARQRGEDVGHAVTPELASRSAANEVHGLVSIEVAEKFGVGLPEGITLHKTWLSRQDSRVRPLHVRLNGRTRKLGEHFWRWPATGQVLAFPGDQRAPMDATANCRCFLVLSLSG